MQKIFTILAFFLLSLPIVAQVKVHIGATTAFNSTFVLDKGLSEDPRYNAEMTYNWAPAGLAFGTDFSHGFGLQLESILSNQGQIYEIVDIAQQRIGERRIDLKYIHLPLLLNFISSNDSRTSFNFAFGPQLSILTQGQEIYTQYQQGTMQLPEGSELPENAVPGSYNSANGTYQARPTTTEIANSASSSAIKQFKDKDLQLAVSMGLNIDLGTHMYLSTHVRGNYGFTDMRNDDLINILKNNSSSTDVFNDLFGRRANLLVGLQLGLHYVIGGNRSSIRSIGSMSR